MAIPTGFTPAKPVYLINDVAARAAGGVALRAVGYTEETALDTGGIESWPRYSIMVIEDADLVVNGGAWTLSTDDAILHLFEWDPSQAPLLNGAPVPVYLIGGELRAWPFLDDFDRPDGSVGNGWMGSSWRLASGNMVNDLTYVGGELFANPGCEGVYSLGLAPNWSKSGGIDCTPSEEGTIIHGGAKAQKVTGGTTDNVGVVPNDVAVTAGHYYMFNGWMRNDGPGSVNARRRVGLLANIQDVVAPSVGVYQHILDYDFAVSTGVESIKASQIGTIPTTWYVDDWSLKEFAYASLINPRLYGSGDIVYGIGITYAGTGEAGIILSLDSSTDPKNYILGVIHSPGNIRLYKVLNRVRTSLVSVSFTPVVGENIELRKIGTTYRLYYSGRQMGGDMIITDAAIINNTYIGTFCWGGSTFNNAYVYPYGYIPDYPVPDYSGYYLSEHYTAGQGIVSLRFDDAPVENYTVIYPLLVARGLVGGFAMVRSYIGLSGSLSLAQLLEMQTAGMEIMCHSMSHDTPPPDWSTFREETEVALIQMRGLGLNVCTFVYPGTWTGASPNYVIDNVSQYGGTVDVFLRKWFKMYVASIESGPDAACRRVLPRPSNLTWGTAFKSMGPFSLANWQDRVDYAAANGCGMDILLHVRELDTPGYMTTATFTAALDYLAAKVAAGTIVVKTPTAQLFATPI